MEPVRAALSSFGLSSRVFHGPFLADNPLYRVVGVLERNTEDSRSIFPKATIHRSFDSLLSDDSVELVVINTPDHLHGAMCEAAIEAGRHVVVEKPMVESARRATELFALAEAKGLVLTVYQNRRYDGDFIAAREIVRSGVIGRLLEFESRFDLWRPVQPEAWREQKAISGGILTNLGSHLADQAVAMFGRPEWVSATLATLRPGSLVGDYMRLELGYDSTAVLLCGSYQACEPGPRFRLRGTAGSWTKWGFDGQEARIKKAIGVGVIPRGGREFAVLRRATREMDADREITESGSEQGASGPEGTEADVEPGDYGDYYRQLFAAIREGAEPPVSPEDAILTASILEAAAESSREGHRVPLPGPL